ncbi:MAG: DNA-3-methyladenine glycosylase 2 family protein [Anaerolineae bacterium]|nr:DNA-3-methyladenine glycosylase 2 family protein [Anaerolineae bacterium]
MKFQFEPNPPYDFALTADSTRYYSVLHQVHEGRLWHGLRLGEARVLVAVSGNPDADAPRLEAEVIASEGAVDERQLETKLRRWLDVDEDLRPFYLHGAQDDALAITIRRLHGLRMLRTQTVFEALMITMIEQQIALSAAQKAERWLVSTYGDAIVHDGRRYPLFPTPETLASLPEEALHPLKITFMRMRRLQAVARAIAEGFDLEGLVNVPHEDAYRVLMQLNGVGHWTAAWTMIRAMGAYTYVGSADVALRAAVGHYWHGKPQKATRQETDDLFSGYGSHGGLASVYTLMRWGIERYASLGADGS